MTETVQQECLEVLKSNLSETLKIKVIALLSKEADAPKPKKPASPPKPPKTVEGWLKTPTGYKQQKFEESNPLSLDNIIASYVSSEQKG